MNILRPNANESKPRFRMGLKWFQGQLQADGIRDRLEKQEKRRRRRTAMIKMIEQTSAKIRFEENPQIRSTLCLDDYSDDEFSMAFYNRSELEKIFDRASSIVDKLEAEEADSRICTRGLEKLYGERQEACHGVRQRSIDAVMDLQKQQWETGADDFDLIARLSLCISKEAVIRALREAKRDIKSVQHYLDDVTQQYLESQEAKAKQNEERGNVQIKSILKSGELQKQYQISRSRSGSPGKRRSRSGSPGKRRDRYPFRSQPRGAPLRTVSMPAVDHIGSQVLFGESANTATLGESPSEHRSGTKEKNRIAPSRTCSMPVKEPLPRRGRGSPLPISPSPLMVKRKMYKHLRSMSESVIKESNSHERGDGKDLKPQQRPSFQSASKSNLRAAKEVGVRRSYSGRLSTPPQVKERKRVSLVRASRDSITRKLPDRSTSDSITRNLKRSSFPTSFSSIRNERRSYSRTTSDKTRSGKRAQSFSYGAE